LNKIELYEKAKGGKLNAYKLFIAKSFDLLNYKGIFCQIFQNSFLADNSAKKIRKFIIEDSKIIKIDSYPERDDVNKRVFESAKMSVCILLCKKQKSTCNDFDLNVWESKNKLKFSVKINRDSIIRFDDKNFVIPTITSEEMKIY
jgi:adenine-specific DNA methylase